LKLAMVRLKEPEWCRGARMVLTVHDELTFEVPEARAQEAAEKVRDKMVHAMELSVPLVVEVGFAASWAGAH
jgi:DNA polymerase-1